MIKLNSKTLAEIIKRSPKYTRVLLSRRGIKMNDLDSIVELINEYTKKNNLLLWKKEI